MVSIMQIFTISNSVIVSSVRMLINGLATLLSPIDNILILNLTVRLPLFAEEGLRKLMSQLLYDVFVLVHVKHKKAIV